MKFYIFLEPIYNCKDFDKPIGNGKVGDKVYYNIFKKFSKRF